MENLRAFRGEERSAVTTLINRTKQKIAHNDIENQELLAATETLVEKKTLLEHLDTQILYGKKIKDMQQERLNSDEFKLHMEKAIRIFKGITSNSGVSVIKPTAMTSIGKLKANVSEEIIHWCKNSVNPKPNKDTRELQDSLQCRLSFLQQDFITFLDPEDFIKDIRRFDDRLTRLQISQTIKRSRELVVNCLLEVILENPSMCSNFMRRFKAKGDTDIIDSINYVYGEKGTMFCQQYFEFIIKFLNGELMDVLETLQICRYLYGIGCLERSDMEHIEAVYSREGRKAACYELCIIVTGKRATLALFVVEGILAIQEYNEGVKKDTFLSQEEKERKLAIEEKERKLATEEKENIKRKIDEICAEAEQLEAKALHIDNKLSKEILLSHAKRNRKTALTLKQKITISEERRLRSQQDSGGESPTPIQQDDHELQDNLQSRVLSLQQDFIKFLKPSDVMSDIQGLDECRYEEILETEKTSREQAVKDLLTYILKNSDLLPKFVVALQARGYRRFIDPIHDVYPKKGHIFCQEYFEFIMNLLKGELADILETLQICRYLYGIGCLEQSDMERIHAVNTTTGKTAACRELIITVRRKRADWALLMIDSMKATQEYVKVKMDPSSTQEDLERTGVHLKAVLMGIRVDDVLMDHSDK